MLCGYVKCLSSSKTTVGKWSKADKENSRYGFNYFNSTSRIQGITRLSLSLSERFSPIAKFLSS